MQFENRLATLTSVVNDSRSDLDAALTDLSVAVGDVQRFVAGSRNQTVRTDSAAWRNVTQNLVDNQMALENILHVAPNALANVYNIYNPTPARCRARSCSTTSRTRSQFICGDDRRGRERHRPRDGEAVSAVPRARRCGCSTSTTCRSRSTPTWGRRPNPDKIIYTEPELAPGGAGSRNPETPPDGVRVHGCRRHTAASGIRSWPGMGPRPDLRPPACGRVTAVAPITGRADELERCSTRLSPRRSNPADVSPPPPLNGTGPPPGPPPGRHPRRPQHLVRHCCPPKGARVMIRSVFVRRAVVIGCGVALTATGCAFHGLNSLPLPGAVGRGPDATIYHVEIAECRHAGVEFAGDDRRRRGRQRGQDDGRQLARRRRDLGQARCRGARQRGGQRRADQPAGVDASGAQSAARAAAERKAATGRHHPAEPIVDLSVDRADAVVAVGRRQRRRTGADRRHHPQLQRRAVRTRSRDPRPAHPAGQFRRHARRTARQHRRVHPAAEPARRHLRRPTRRASTRRCKEFRPRWMC